jgi:hypothetical protein
MFNGFNESILSLTRSERAAIELHVHKGSRKAVGWWIAEYVSTKNKSAQLLLDRVVGICFKRHFVKMSDRTDRWWT